MSKKKPSPEKAPVKTVKQEKKAACRIFALLFLVAAVAAFFLPYAIPGFEATMLFNAVLTIFPANFYEVAAGVISTLFNVSIYVFAALLILSAVLSIVALINGKRKPVIAAIILIALGALIYTSLYCVVTSADVFGIDLASLILAIAAIILTIVCILFTKPVVKEIKEEPVKAPDDGFHVEEYAEAMPYEGGPVAGVLMAEEVNPSFVPQNPRVNTAGYDFYNSKTFDPFIASLDDAERNEFTEIFILKIKGVMPELPDYEVGGDNKEFFRKIFIYLGQYRDRLSSALLGKMYQYSLKIN